jgi:hypothetical protein
MEGNEDMFMSPPQFLEDLQSTLNGTAGGGAAERLGAHQGKHIHRDLTETPNITEITDNPVIQRVTDKTTLIQKVNEISLRLGGFRVYKHSDQPCTNRKEHRLMLLCQ